MENRKFDENGYPYTDLSDNTFASSYDFDLFSDDLFLEENDTSSAPAEVSARPPAIPTDSVPKAPAEDVSPAVPIDPVPVIPTEPPVFTEEPLVISKASSVPVGDSECEPTDIPVEAPSINIEEYRELDTYADSGEYRSYTGNREYRSFDAAMPEAPDEGWYHYSDEDNELDDQDEYEDYDEDDDYDDESPKKLRPLKFLFNTLFTLLTVFSIIYLVAIYSNNEYIVKYRTMYIQTGMSTINHKWLVTSFIPSEMIDEVMLKGYDSALNQHGQGSNWGDVEIAPLPSFERNSIDAESENPEASAEEISIDTADREPTMEELFFSIFSEIDPSSMKAYVEKHPEVIKDGWDQININEAGLSDSGTDILTVNGDQILAINAQQGIVLIRIYLSSSRGVLAICKDTSRLSLCPASSLGTIGQTAGRICDANNGILSLTGSAFMDDGSSNGGQISGLAVCNWTTYGNRLGGVDKRLELRADNKMYIVDSTSSVDSYTRDACEFRPALIIDGKISVDENCGWTSPNPRAVLGQSDKLETMMVVVEGRFADSPGCSVVDIAELLQEYGCVQALNLDGGTSAIMYYDGEYITRCSNTALPGGRTLPTAWVYKKA